jgi:hypothetical protein
MRVVVAAEERGVLLEEGDERCTRTHTGQVLPKMAICCSLLRFATQFQKTNTWFRYGALEVFARIFDVSE